MSPANSARISVTTRLSATDTERILQLESAAAVEDGVPPLDDQVHLDLRYGDGTARHLLARTSAADSPVGYAHVHVREADTPPGPAHVVVDPQRRRRGVGSALLTKISDLLAPDPVQVWAHGDLPAARELGRRAGLRRARELWKMQRPLDGELPAPVYPSDVTVRSFVPGVDEAVWLEVNAAAFARHPEQGSVTAQGLAQRMALPDFDPDGFFLAERNGQLVGFHWTKVHPRTDKTAPTGEVYVLGVHPQAQGLGLGKALALTGLRFLARHHVPTVMLYVEADNPSAVALYSRLGFAHTTTDVLYIASVGAREVHGNA